VSDDSVRKLSYRLIINDDELSIPHILLDKEEKKESEKAPFGIRTEKIELSSLSNNSLSKLCPKCGLKGSLHYRWVKNSQGKKYYYPYFSHYNPSNQGIRWCYIQRKTLKTIE
jgi:hypothetical protein